MLYSRKLKRVSQVKQKYGILGFGTSESKRNWLSRVWNSVEDVKIQYIYNIVRCERNMKLIFLKYIKIVYIHWNWNC